MANATVHSDQARDHLAAALLLRHDNPSGAGEMAYGALIQATIACAHRKHDHGHSHSRKAVIRVIRNAPLNRAAADTMINAVNVAFTKLHGGFYDPGNIDPLRHNNHIDRTGRITQLLLAQADS